MVWDRFDITTGKHVRASLCRAVRCWVIWARRRSLHAVSSREVRDRGRGHGRGSMFWKLPEPIDFTGREFVVDGLRLQSRVHRT